MRSATSELVDKLAQLKIVPVIVIDDPGAAVPLARALTEGGLPCAEVTFRTAGATFIVAPGFNPAVVDHCLEHGIPVCPGVCTPTDIEAALAKGLTTVKFFPAEPIGGLKYLKAIAAPYTMMRFVPTGGINADNIRSYLAFDRVVAGGGSWMAPAEWIAARAFDRIRDETAGAVRAARGDVPSTQAPAGVSRT